jgi:hypothetical protein
MSYPIARSATCRRRKTKQTEEERRQRKLTDLRKIKIKSCLCFFVLQVTMALTAGREGKRERSQSRSPLVSRFFSR